MFKKFSFRAFFLCILVVIALMIGSFFAAAPRDSGHPVPIWVTGVFNTLRFPSHVVFGSGAIESWGAVLGGMALNILLFTFVLERLTAIFRRRRGAAAPPPVEVPPPSAHNPY